MIEILQEKIIPILRMPTEPVRECPITPITDEIWNTIRKRCLYMTLCITNKCNMPCKVCIMHDEQGRSPFQELSKKDIEFVMQKIGTNKKVVLFGGEPTLRNDLVDIIKIVKDSGNIPMLYTNGIKLADPEYVKMLNKSGLEKLYLSIHSLKEEATNILNGDRDYLYLKLKALENLRKIGTIKFWLSSMIAHEVNHNEIPSLLNLVISDKSNLIKGIYFLAATHFDSSLYRLSPETATSVNFIIKKIEEATNGALSLELFQEFNRLKKNLNIILRKFGAGLPPSPDRLLVRRLRGKLEPLIPLTELKKINNSLEKKNYFDLFKYTYKYRSWLGLMRRVFHTSLVEFETEDKGEIIFIETTYMTDSPIPSLNIRGMVNLAKIAPSFVLVNQGPA